MSPVVLRVWRWLTYTAVPPGDSERMMRAEWFAVMTLIVSPVVVLAVVLARALFEFSPRDFDTWTIAVALLCYPAAFFINRAGQYEWAAALILLSTTVATWIAPYTPRSSEILALLTVLSLLLALLFYSEWFVLRYLLLALVTNGVLTQFSPYVAFFRDRFQLAFVITLFSCVLLLAYFYQRRRIERLRQAELAAANEALRRSEAALGARVALRTSELNEARRLAETLFHLSEQVNRAQTYDAVVAAVYATLNAPDCALSIVLFDTLDRATAHYAYAPAEIGAYAGPPDLAAMRFPVYAYAVDAEGVAVIEDVARDESIDRGLQAAFLALDVAAILGAELRLGDRTLGLLNLGCVRPRSFSGREREVLAAAADLVSAAVERIYLYEEQVRIAEQLRSLDETKNQFLAATSHELRTPLNAVINFTQFVSTGMYGPVNEKQREGLEKATGSARHLLSLINDILDMSKIAAGRMVIAPEPNVDVRAELLAVAETARSLVHGKPVAVVCDAPDDLPRITCDRRRLQQILLNLVSNAAKFTEAGTVRIAGRARDGWVELTVADSGPGISAVHQGVIFEPFTQNPEGLTRTGTGLGLPITRSLVEAHGGQLRLESVVGQGSTFTVRLPVGGPVD